MLRDLDALPDRQRVVMMASYDVFNPDANCADARGPTEARGLSAQDIDLLIDMNRHFNDVLRYHAQRYGFSVAEPHLAPAERGGESDTWTGPAGLSDPAPFHPTAVGEIRLAAAVSEALATEPPPREGKWGGRAVIAA